MVRRQVARDRHLPPVSVREQLLLVIEQLLVRLRRELEVRALNDGIHGTSLLAEAAVNAFGHVDIVSSCATRAVLSFLRIDRDRLRGTYCLAKLTSDTTFLSAGITTQH